jgi:hypothetical protein
MLNVGSSRTVFVECGISVPDVISPLIALRIINAWVFTAGRNTWEAMATEQLREPTYAPRFCRTARCPNAAFAYVQCNACCQYFHGVEVWRSDLPNATCLALFASKQFAAGDYVVDLTWNMKDGHDCMIPECWWADKRVPDGQYVLKGEDGNYKFQADVGQMVHGKKK